MTDTNKLTRRGLLGTFAATSAVTLAACGEDAAPAGPNPDIVPLNNLLTKEYEIVKAYAAVIPTLAAPHASDPETLNATALSLVMGAWQRHHHAHATQLAAAVTAVGGTPVAEASVMFTMPSSYSSSVTNALKLLCNVERAIAIEHNRAVKALTAMGNRFLVGTIEGDETQHFIVLYTLAKRVVVPVPTGLISGLMDVVPKAFVAKVSTNDTNSLQSIEDLPYSSA